MDMNKVFFLRREDRDPRWHVIDASNQVLGRLATQVADLLRGKLKADYTPQTDGGDYVIITNCEKVRLTGNKWKDKMYVRYTGFRSGRKETSAREMFAKDPRELVLRSVKGMLPKNKLNRGVFKKLRIYVGNEHTHEAQVKGFPVL